MNATTTLLPSFRLQPHFSTRFMEIPWIRMAFSTPELQDPKTPEKPPVATPWVPSNMAWRVDCNAPRFQGDRGKHHLMLPSPLVFQWDDQLQVGCINQSLCSEWSVLQPLSSGMLWSLAWLSPNSHGGRKWLNIKGGSSCNPAEHRPPWKFGGPIPNGSP